MGGKEVDRSQVMCLNFPLNVRGLSVGECPGQLCVYETLCLWCAEWEEKPQSKPTLLTCLTSACQVIIRTLSEHLYGRTALYSPRQPLPFSCSSIFFMNRDLSPFTTHSKIWFTHRTGLFSLLDNNSPVVFPLNILLWDFWYQWILYSAAYPRWPASHPAQPPSAPHAVIPYLWIILGSCLLASIPVAIKVVQGLDHCYSLPIVSSLQSCPIEVPPAHCGQNCLLMWVLSPSFPILLLLTNSKEKCALTAGEQWPFTSGSSAHSGPQPAPLPPLIRQSRSAGKMCEMCP